MFTLGCPKLILAVDLRPLTGILNDRSLDSIDNPRLLKLIEKTLPYSFEIMYVPGTSDAIKTADALSRNPTCDSSSDDAEDIATSSCVSARAFAVTQAENVESITWQRVVEAAAVDQECIALAQQIVHGFPEEKSLLPQPLQPYWGMRHELYVVDNVPFKGRKILIPSRLRPFVLDGLHAANQGVTGMLANA